MSAVDRPRVGVIVHRAKNLGGGLEELRAVLADYGHADPPWYEVDKSKFASKKVSKLVEKDGIDRLLVWGGDGTLRRCVDTVLHEGYDDVAIACLPAGTANLLALNLGIPVDVRAAVDIALHGEVRPLDAGLVNDDEHFVVMAGAGFDAMLIRDADDSGAKDRFGRLGYVMAGVRNRNMSPARAEIHLDGDPWYTGDASCVIAGNVGRLIGGLPAFPDASPDDGRLDVGVVAARKSSDWARLFGSVVAGRTATSPFAQVATAQKIVIELDRTLPWQADGGDRDRNNRFEIQCLPAAVRFCRPRTETKEHTS